MWAVVGVPETKVPISGTTFASYILPPLFFYFTLAILAIKPGTRILRLVCWPVLALLALRTTVSVDIVPSNFNRKLHNDFANVMSVLVARALYWAVAKEPLVRHLRPAKSTPSTLMDAIDLAFTFRGCGWGWSHGLYVPRETRPAGRAAFVSYVAMSTAIHTLLFGTLHRAIRSFSPAGLGSISGISIFDESLPFHLRYLRSCIIALIGCLAVYNFLQMCYDSCTVVGVLILGQDPAQWPPSFDSPWRSTSISQFWGYRWHQWYRHMFLIMGGYPLSFIFGRAGLVIGAFLGSAVHHHVVLHSLDPTSEFWRMAVGFGMMAVGIFAEQAFRRLTGRRVCGLAGWVWAMSWILVWGNLIIDGFVRAGMFRSFTLIDGVPPLRVTVERLVMDLDTWLHAIPS